MKIDGRDEVRASEVRASKVGELQVGAGEIGSLKIRRSQPSPDELGVGEDGPREGRRRAEAFERSASERSTPGVRAAASRLTPLSFARTRLAPPRSA